MSDRTNEIIVPTTNDAYTLGSAKIEVIDVSADQGNDSLVLLITYGKTRFLFTGNIVEKAHSRVSSVLRGMSDELKTGENLIKMPHHGGYNADPSLPSGASDNSLATFVDAAYARCFAISVGEGDSYGLTHRETISSARHWIRMCRHLIALHTTSGPTSVAMWSSLQTAKRLCLPTK